MGFEPQDKVAVITGAAGGIGLGMARAFVGAGMKVVLSDYDAKRVEESAAALRAAGHDAIGMVTDVSKRADVEALAEAAMDAHGRVDVLCNNAGVALLSKIAESTIEEWEWTLGIDLWGPIYGVKTFLPLIERNVEGGHINSTASVAGLIAASGAGSYNVAKHGVVALMATLERELRSSRSVHRASVLCPGAINTGIGGNSVRQHRALTAGAQPEGVERLGEHRSEAEKRSPSVIAGSTTNSSDTGRKIGDRMSAALAAGMDPDDVGRLVLDAIRAEQFWIFTHPPLLRHATEQLALAESERQLTKGRLV